MPNRFGPQHATNSVQIFAPFRKPIPCKSRFWTRSALEKMYRRDGAIRGADFPQRAVEMTLRTPGCTYSIRYVRYTTRHACCGAASIKEGGERPPMATLRPWCACVALSCVPRLLCVREPRPRVRVGVHALPLHKEFPISFILLDPYLAVSFYS